MPFCHAELRAAKPKPSQYPKQLNTLGDHIRTRRLDLKLLQGQVADQIGVHEQTITNWERNAAVPTVRYMPSIIQFLSYDPLSPTASFSERLIAAGRVLGLSQRKMAEKLSVDPGTLQGWEVGQHTPSRRKLQLIATFLA
ncbi:MAG: helix-turn-helix transcriptional regulator [Acidobacteriaceae bacterium]